MKGYEVGLDKSPVKYVCPSCGKKTFTYYVYLNTGERVGKDVGICDRINHCKYHYPPRDYFRDNPRDYRPITLVRNFDEAITKPFDFIPFHLIEESEGRDNSLIVFLKGLFPVEDVERVARMYHLGTTRQGEVIFPLISDGMRCNSGKIMRYDSNGHRIKNGVSWLHTRWMKGQGKSASDFNRAPCLFGQHLLAMRPDGIVGVVESEKTAVIATLTKPDAVWVATGGCSGLTPKVCAALKGRRVVVYPDADKVEEWTEKAGALTMCRSVKVSSWAKDEPTGSTRDIADVIVQQRLGRITDN